MYVQFYHLFSVVVKHFLYGIRKQWKDENPWTKKTKTWNDSVM